MGIHRIKGEVAFSCDECPMTIETGKPGFHQAVEYIRDQGWATAFWEGEYQHHCPECAKKMGSA
jgi:hypothetical protein